MGTLHLALGVLGARRDEVVALQWEDIDLNAGVVRLDENYVRTAEGMLLKDTKTHQMRRVSIDVPRVALLRQYRDECSARLPPGIAVAIVAGAWREVLPIGRWCSGPSAVRRGPLPVDGDRREAFAAKERP